MTKGQASRVGKKQLDTKLKELGVSQSNRKPLIMVGMRLEMGKTSHPQDCGFDDKNVVVTRTGSGFNVQLVKKEEATA